MRRCPVREREVVGCDRPRMGARGTRDRHRAGDLRDRRARPHHPNALSPHPPQSRRRRRRAADPCPREPGSAAGDPRPARAARAIPRQREGCGRPRGPQRWPSGRAPEALPSHRAGGRRHGPAAAAHGERGGCRRARRGPSSGDHARGAGRRAGAPAARRRGIRTRGPHRRHPHHAQHRDGPGGRGVARGRGGASRAQPTRRGRRADPAAISRSPPQFDPRHSRDKRGTPS